MKTGKPKTLWQGLSVVTLLGAVGSEEAASSPTMQSSPVVQSSKTEATLEEASQRNASELARQVQWEIASVSKALQAGDRIGAARSLDRSAVALRQIYLGIPEREVLRHMEQLESQLSRPSADVAAGPSPSLREGFAALAAEVEERAPCFDPLVRARTFEAKKKLDSDDLAEAARQLREARKVLTADIAYAPVENAYVRVLAAKTAVDEGDLTVAGQLLDGVPASVASVEVAVPLVPVRFELRAAAVAAEQGNWMATQDLVGQASERLHRLESVTTQPAAGRLRPIGDRVRSLQKRLDSNEQPKPKDIRDVAQRTRLEL